MLHMQVFLIQVSHILKNPITFGTPPSPSAALDFSIGFV